MSRGSAISRVREYFKEAPLDEVEVVFALITKDLASRKQVTSKPVVHRQRRRVRNHEVVQPAQGQSTQQEIA